MENTFITPIQPLDLSGRITPIQPLKSISDVSDTDSLGQVSGADGISLFKSIFEERIENVRNTEDNLAKQEYRLATGQIDDPHTVGIAASKAQLATDMLVSMRTKALEAYNEIMRISL